MNKERVLVLAPHTDDAELGAGGTIARFTEEGVSVKVVAFSTCVESLPADWPKDTLKQEMMRALPQLGVPAENITTLGFPVRRLNEHRQDVLEELVRIRRDYDPDLVFLPSGNDIHQDHQVLHQEGMRAFKMNTLFAYELPWNQITFHSEVFITLEEKHVQKKIAALKCYDSQMEKYRPYFEEDFIRSWARVRGVQVNAGFAEVFEGLRIIT